jgi:hypothetical protein
MNLNVPSIEGEKMSRIIESVNPKESEGFYVAILALILEEKKEM